MEIVRGLKSITICFKTKYNAAKPRCLREMNAGMKLCAG